MSLSPRVDAILAHQKLGNLEVWKIGARDFSNGIRSSTRNMCDARPLATLVARR